MAPVPLIIDTDPGIDDILAIVLALDRPDLVQLKAITLTFGNTTLDHCRNNMLQLFDILQKHIAEDPSEAHRAKLAKTFASAPITLSKGAIGPLGGQRFTASYFHGRDGVSGISTLPGNPWPLPEKVPEPLQETEKAAHDVILDTIRSNPPGTVRIAAVGPLTNIALAWQKDPETFSKVGGISVMGAALDVPGNTTPCAEFNTFADPFAVRELLHNAPLHPVLRKQGKRLPVDLLPLDITTEHLVPFERLCGDKIEKKGILQRYLAAILVSPRKNMNSYADPDKPFDPSVNDLFQSHDPLAVGHAMFCPSPVQRLGQLPDKESLINQAYEGWQMKTREFGVETDGALTRGYCVVDRRAHGKVKAGHSRVEKEAPVSGSDKESVKVASKEDEQTEEKPTKGAWDVLVASPGIDWFGEQLCKALNV